MKNKLNIIRDYALIVAFCGAIVAGMWNVREIRAMRTEMDSFGKKIESLENFRLEQVGINGKDEAIYGLVVELIMDE